MTMRSMDLTCLHSWRARLMNHQGMNSCISSGENSRASGSGHGNTVLCRTGRTPNCSTLIAIQQKNTTSSTATRTSRINCMRHSSREQTNTTRNCWARNSLPQLQRYHYRAYRLPARNMEKASSLFIREVLLLIDSSKSAI